MKVSFIASGDSFITRHVADCGYPGFSEICDLIKSHDVSFANLEMTFIVRRAIQQQQAAELGQ